MYAEQPSASPLIRCLWRVDVTHDGSWISPANEFWGLAFGEDDGRRSGELIGPSLEPRHLSARAGGRFWGVEFEAHVFWRGLDKLAVLGEIRDLPLSGPDHVELAGVRYPFTPYEGLGSLVATLVGQGVLVAEPLVAPRGVPPRRHRSPRRTLPSRHRPKFRHLRILPRTLAEDCRPRRRQDRPER